MDGVSRVGNPWWMPNISTIYHLSTDFRLNNHLKTKKVNADKYQVILPLKQRKADIRNRELTPK